MNETANLALPYIMEAQAQKHVTHNDAIRALDAVVQLGVLDRDLAAPPTSPTDGERYIIKAGATGAWAGKDNQIAAFQDNAWMIYQPRAGWLAWVGDEDKLVRWDGTGWSGIPADISEIQNATYVGVNAAADDTNKLAVKSDAVLFSHDDVTPGSGDIQHKLNKATVNNTAAFLFQTNFSGRAEFGLSGDDDWHVKTSPDGSNWNEALVADKNDGSVSFPSGARHAASGKPLSMLVLTPGGTGVTTTWRFDAARTGLPRTATISSVSSDLITLTATVADQFFTNASMEGLSYISIWNTSKSPEQRAWIRKRGTTSELYVKDSASISGWANGDVIRMGEPKVGSLTLNVVAVDISQQMQLQLGAVFPQAGLLLKCAVSASGAGGMSGQIGVTADGSGGSALNTYSDSTGSITQTMPVVGSTELSPISNSNLLFIREVDDGSGAMRVGAVSVMGFYV